MSRILFMLMLLRTLPQGSGSISGQILNASGTPAVAVRVSAMPADAQAANLSVLSAFALTDSSGRYRIDNVEPGTYYVIAGLVAQPTYFPGVAAQAGARTVQVRQGASITGLDFKIVTTLAAPPRGGFFPTPTPTLPLPTFSVSGKVALKPGQKLPPYLRIIPSGLISAPVRPDGSFVATGLQAGTYWFGTGLVPKPPDFVVVDKDITGLSVALPLTGLLTGSIETTARPLNEPISLWLVDAANPASRVGVSSARSFELDLPEGEYRVAADGIPDGYRIDSVTVDGASVQSGFFKMAPDSRMRLVITVSEKPGSASSSPAAPALRQVFGRVERQGANATGVVGLRFSDASGPRATVLFDMSLADPTFLLALPAGEYKVEAMLPATGNQLTLRIKSATYRSLDILSMPLRITEESAGEIRVVIETLQ